MKTDQAPFLGISLAMMSCGLIRGSKYKLLLLVVAVVLMTFFFGHYQYSVRLVKTEISDRLDYLHGNNYAAFLVDTPFCKIMNIDPFDSSISQFTQKGKPTNCEYATPSITYRNGTRLCIDWNKIKKAPYHGNIKYCKYQPIFRPHNVSQSHNYYMYLPYSERFSGDIPIHHEFIKVDCYSRRSKKMYTNFHSFVFPKAHVEARCQQGNKDVTVNGKDTEKLNVLMVAVDSVSRLNFMRQMPETRSFLLNDLKAVELAGYNKVADNTFVNIVPMTTGKFVEELPWNESLSQLSMDKYDFIWKLYANRGYRTLYAEDAPEIAIFDYLKAGFARPPADYFNRHFSVAMEEEKGLWSRGHNCFLDKLETDTVLEYIDQFVSTFRSYPHFGFAFITRLTHDSLQSSAAADQPYLKFLRKLRHQSLLNNTVLMFFSDHGMRFGDIRETYIGKLEERLPFMFLVFPDWFLQKYPHIANNLQINSHRLTTPFDIHETLLSILNFKDQVIQNSVAKRGLSLFGEVPKERTCKHAGILPHWCTCQQHETVPNTSRAAKNASQAVVRKINQILTKEKSICSYLELKQILTALKVIVSDKVLRFENSVNDVIDRHVSYGKRVSAFVDYQLTVRTVPGGGLFEATVRHDEDDKSYTVMGDISRINRYGDQSHCADNHIIKKYCFCRTQLKNS